MSKPTINEDLDDVRMALADCNSPQERRHACEALTRIRAALAEREHLLKGAALLQYVFDCAEANVEPSELDIQRTQAWLSAERARLAREGT